MAGESFEFRSRTEAAVFSDPTSLRYLTGLRLTAGTALISPRHRILYVDGRYLFKARRMLGRPWRVCPMRSDLSDLFRDFKKIGLEKICVDTQSLSAAQYKRWLAAGNGVEIVDAEGLADRVRAVKRPGELKILREAVRLTDELWSRLRTNLRIGMTERELLVWIKSEALRLGADEMSFEPIVVSGPSTAEPHAEASDKKISGDEPLMVDMGIRLAGYCSDFTRTPYLLRRRGAPPDWFVKFRNEVLAIQSLAYRLISRGVRSPKHITKEISKRLGRSHLAPHYLHSLGHGVGMKIHEEPFLSDRGCDLKDGMVFTVEPGLYRAGYGGVRIEDMACLWNGRLDVMTRSSKELVWRV